MICVYFYLFFFRGVCIDQRQYEYGLSRKVSHVVFLVHYPLIALGICHAQRTLMPDGVFPRQMVRYFRPYIYHPPRFFFYR